MKEIKRDYYLNKLIEKDGNGLIKIITGIRRSGKSYLLGEIFYNYLLNNNDASHILYITLDTKESEKLLDGNVFLDYVYSKIKDNKKYYLLIDEIQKMDNFVPVLNSLMYKKNIEIYVTGSNAKLLSKDILTEFRGRGDDIHVYPLSFKEYYDFLKGDKYELFNQYCRYGGLPLTLSLKTESEKSTYLKNLFDETYITDILERNNVYNKDELNELLNVLSSSTGSLTNPYRLSNVFKHEKHLNLEDKTISNYIEYFIDAFIIKKAERYDIKGKKYINSPFKYYFEDVGLRNARLNFRQDDYGHIMENIIYNELVMRGYNVDVGIVDVYETTAGGNRIKPQYEVDFICNIGSKKIYIQSAYQIYDEQKKQQEIKSLLNINDSFKKIVIVNDSISPQVDENGIVTMGIYYFLLNENSLDI